MSVATITCWCCLRLLIEPSYACPKGGNSIKRTSSGPLPRTVSVSPDTVTTTWERRNLCPSREFPLFSTLAHITSYRVGKILFWGGGTIPGVCSK
uniref:Putative secreted protein n=1 Tax=Anopheles triannulatus TaxID=58253 RepID=A0A2M4B3B4_9DIPT